MIIIRPSGKSDRIEPLLTKRYDVLLTNLVKSRIHCIECYNDRITLTFDNYVGNAAVCLMSERLEKFTP